MRPTAPTLTSPRCLDSRIHERSFQPSRSRPMPASRFASKMYARSTLYAQSGRAEAPRRAMLTYLNDTAEPRNAYPDYWGLSSEWEALSTIGREGYCSSISIGAGRGRDVADQAVEERHRRQRVDDGKGHHVVPRRLGAVPELLKRDGDGPMALRVQQHVLVEVLAPGQQQRTRRAYPRRFRQAPAPANALKSSEASEALQAERWSNR